MKPLVEIIQNAISRVILSRDSSPGLVTIMTVLGVSSFTLARPICSIHGKKEDGWLVYSHESNRSTLSPIDGGTKNASCRAGRRGKEKSTCPKLSKEKSWSQIGAQLWARESEAFFFFFAFLDICAKYTRHMCIGLH